MNPQKHDEIREQAKQLMKKFAASLQKVKFKKKEKKEKVGGFREEGEGKIANEDFRKRFFDNAPEKDGDFIVAEKKEW